MASTLPAVSRFYGMLGLRNRKCLNIISSSSLRPFCSANIYSANDQDPAPYFFDDKVQGILKRVTGVDLNRVYRTRLLEKKLKVPRYEFLTDQELQELTAKAQEKAEHLLQMPPVMKERMPIDVVLSKDPAISGYTDAKHLFADITFGVTDRKRTILARDTDGTLRHASWDERERVNQIYNPRPGRKLPKPKMFEEDNLKDVFAREKYEFILDRACGQFEPDDPEYQRVCSLTYETIDEKRHFQMLHSTRHYGPMCFYLTWHRKIDGLLIDLLQQEKLSNCADVVELYQVIHKDSKSANLGVAANDHVNFVKAYIENDSLRRPQLQLAMQRYEDLLHERQQYDETVQTSHGL